MRMMRMFEGITKSKFYRKCKWDLKQIRTRIDLIMKKRNAMQKYLRNDIVDLLKNDLDINAYGRAEGLIVEMNRTYCYEYVDQCCEQILNHLEAMDKDRECPEECREAAWSLMFAAARFADLPELRQLRTLFCERYGNSLDYHVSKQFSDKAKSGLPSKEAKLQLLEDIAEKCGLEWSSKALGNNLYNASAIPQEIKTKDAVQWDQGEYLMSATSVSDIPEDDSIPCINAVSVRDEEKPPLKYNLIPPPYTKPVEDMGGDGNGKAVTSVRTPTNRPSPREEGTLNKINKENAAQGHGILKCPMEDQKEPNRSSSLRSNLDENVNVHVHPRLPDYDDFVARLAALREDDRR